MSSPPSHLIYTCWAPADEWQLGFVMLGANVRSIPPPPPSSDPIIGLDGFWGVHEWTIYPQMYRPEFPYLAWIPLRPRSHSVPSDVLTRPVEKAMWRAHPLRTDCHLINPELFEQVTIKWKLIKVALEDPFHVVSSQASFSSIERPMKAYTRAFESLNRLEKDFRAWRDFVEVFRNLQQCLLELCAFLDWWEDVCENDSFQSRICAPTCGSIFRDEQLYTNHAHWSIASYLLILRPTFALDLAREVALSPRTLCSVQPMSSESLVHSLHHWYYPPLVNDIVADLETTAQGYLDRLDTFQPSKELKRTFERTESKQKDQAGHRAKKVKTDTAVYISQSNHPELKCLDLRLLGSQRYKSSPRRFSLPPIQLFWSSNEENQRIFYYHFLLLRHALQERRMSDLPPLTMSEWKTILGNTYWKTQWPKRDDPLTAIFDPDVFWKHGGPLFFGDIRSAKVAVGHHDPTSQLPCRCGVQISTADHPDVRQAILYYLNSFHIYKEVMAMERFQFKAISGFEKRWRLQKNWVYHIVEMWDAADGATDFKFFHNKKVWTLWLFSLCEVITDWDGFDSWDWDGISNVKILNIDSLLGPVFCKLLPVSFAPSPLSLFPPV
ncbi:hypothetical protein EDB85DRAFT_2153130 [Lactarius pseudohatsudake]|nr:hypothetical protein EDB85DRAFT_2153130 [Lactarius pseudohatsudake]